MYIVWSTFNCVCTNFIIFDALEVMATFFQLYYCFMSHFISRIPSLNTLYQYTHTHTIKSVQYRLPALYLSHSVYSIQFRV